MELEWIYDWAEKMIKIKHLLGWKNDKMKQFILTLNFAIYFFQYLFKMGECL